MFCYRNEKKHLLVLLNLTKVLARVNKLPAVLSRDLARFGLFGEAEIWSHDSLPNLICKNLGNFAVVHGLKDAVSNDAEGGLSGM